MKKTNLEKPLKNYRFQLFPSPELQSLVREALRDTPDPLIKSGTRGWFSKLIRTSLKVYIAYCKTMNEKRGQSQSDSLEVK